MAMIKGIVEQDAGNYKGYSGVEKNKKTMVGIEYAKW